MRLKAIPEAILDNWLQPGMDSPKGDRTPPLRPCGRTSLPLTAPLRGTPDFHNHDSNDSNAPTASSPLPPSLPSL